MIFGIFPLQSFTASPGPQVPGNRWPHPLLFPALSTIVMTTPPVQLTLRCCTRRPIRIAPGGLEVLRYAGAFFSSLSFACSLIALVLSLSLPSLSPSSFGPSFGPTLTPSRLSSFAPALKPPRSPSRRPPSRSPSFAPIFAPSLSPPSLPYSVSLRLVRVLVRVPVRVHVRVPVRASIGKRERGNLQIGWGFIPS